jgi:hypothetical protein
VTSAERLATLYQTLASLGLTSLVMGGHAVRYYGVDRNTFDYDFHLALDLDAWHGLFDRLRGSRLFADLSEGPSWRPLDFRRFIVGRLPDGREELLECWRRNHLLPPFPELFGRREEGLYGGSTIAFLGLLDLIRSKETEREDDWRDIALLEEIADQRALAAGDRDRKIAALAGLRSRRGLEEAGRTGLLSDSASARAALLQARNPITAALLTPYAHEEAASLPAGTSESIRKLLEGPLRQVSPLTARHLALVEVVRRVYKRDAMSADRADKEAQARG